MPRRKEISEILELMEKTENIKNRRIKRNSYSLWNASKNITRFLDFNRYIVVYKIRIAYFFK